MKNQPIHTKKQIILKGLALVLVFVYLVQPFNDQILDVLHKISHKVKLVGHPTHQGLNSHDLEEHSQQIHKIHKIGHHHEILNVIHNLFEAASNPNDSNDTSIVVKHTIDKHLVRHNDYLKIKWVLETFSYFPDLHLITLKGYLPLEYPPPKLS
ncbi:MAG: hypothetical protein AAGA43_14090 [Bacteroidota bacterium]